MNKPLSSTRLDMDLHKKRLGYPHPFTLVELLLASTIGLLVIVGMITFSLSSLKSLKCLEGEADMRQQGARAVEQFKIDLALSASEKLILAPNESSAAAVSFPILKRTDHSTAPATTDEIYWTHTVIYHLRKNRDGTQDLCRTIFSDRDNSVTDSARLVQANRVLIDGNGENALNASHSSTTVLVKNVSDFSVGKGSKTIDAHASQDAPVLSQIGYVRLSSGSHVFRFETADSENTRQNIGIDALYLTPSGGAIDGEIMINNLTSGGGTVSVNSLLPAFKWKNNAQLLLSTTSPNSFVQFNVYNDMWVESEFARKGAFTYGTSVTTDAIVNPDTSLATPVALKLDGMKDVWLTDQQIDTMGDPDVIKSPAQFADKEIWLRINHPINANGLRITLTGKGGCDEDGQGADTKIAWVQLRYRDDPSTALHNVTFGGSTTVTLSSDSNQSNYKVQSDTVDVSADTSEDYIIVIKFAADSAPCYIAPFTKDGQTGLELRDDPLGWGTYAQSPLLDHLLINGSTNWEASDELDATRDAALIKAPVNFADRVVKLHLYGDPDLPDSVIYKNCKISFAGLGLSRDSFDNQGNLITDADGNPTHTASTVVNAIWIKEDGVSTSYCCNFNLSSSWWQWNPTTSPYYYPSLHYTLSDSPALCNWINLTYDPRKDYTILIRTDATSAPYYMAPFMLNGKTGVETSGNTYAQCPLVTSVYGGYPESGTYISRIFDTKLTAPAYATIYGLMNNITDGKNILIQARSGDDPNLSDAPDWADITGQNLTATPAPLTNVAIKRFVQFKATLSTVTPYIETPVLQSSIITWAGPEKIVDLSGIFTHGPDYGKFIIYMDGNPLYTVNTFLSFKVKRTIQNQTVTKSFYISTGSHQIEGDWTL